MVASPQISIIIPCFNHGHYITEAIESVLSHPNPSIYEIIIINDGSTEVNTIETLKQLEKENFHVIHQKNKGLSAARNIGIKAARGKYILPLDSDNKIRPSYIDKSIAVLNESSHIGVVYGNSHFFGEQEKINDQLIFSPFRLFKWNFIDACAVFRREIWASIGGYDENNIMRLGSEDWEFWMRVYMAGWQFHYINEVLFDYRVRNDSMLRTTTTDNYPQIVNYIFSKPEYHLAKHYHAAIMDSEKRKKIIETQKKEIKRLTTINNNRNNKEKTFNLFFLMKKFIKSIKKLAVK